MPHFHTVAWPNRGKRWTKYPLWKLFWKLWVDLSLVKMYKEQMRYFGYFVCGVTISGVTNYTVNMYVSFSLLLCHAAALSCYCSVTLQLCHANTLSSYCSVMLLLGCATALHWSALHWSALLCTFMLLHYSTHHCVYFHQSELYYVQSSRNKIAEFFKLCLILMSTKNYAV